LFDFSDMVKFFMCSELLVFYLQPSCLLEIRPGKRSTSLTGAMLAAKPHFAGEVSSLA
jgi:hypothetical protein